jgi:hypothetical protein
MCSGSSPRIAIHVIPVALRSCQVIALRVASVVWSSARVTLASMGKLRSPATEGRVGTALYPEVRVVYKTNAHCELVIACIIPPRVPNELGPPQPFEQKKASTVRAGPSAGIALADAVDVVCDQGLLMSWHSTNGRRAFA